MMSPRPAVNHNRAITNISRIFSTYLRGKRCESFSDGIGVHLDEKNIVIPDVVCNRDIIKGNGIYGAPDLVVEVLSPSTAKLRDRKGKEALYEKYGVKKYWIIDSLSKLIEVDLPIDGKFDLDAVYTVYPEWQWAKMTIIKLNELDDRS